jgi:hypothetical protein
VLLVSLELTIEFGSFCATRTPLHPYAGEIAAEVVERRIGSRMNTHSLYRQREVSAIGTDCGAEMVFQNGKAAFRPDEKLFALCGCGQ